jgi:DNA polymerase-3 subunit beta
MKKADLTRALTKVQGITGKKSNIPITSNVVLIVKDKELQVSATDLEIAFQGTYELETGVTGDCAIPSRKFYEIVREFPSESLLVKELENKWIQVRNDKVEYNIVGMDTDEFPGIPSIEGMELFDMDGDVLRDMIEKTQYAVLTDEGRVNLTGVFFEQIVEGDQKRLRMVATDGHRLSRIDFPVETDMGFSLRKGVIVPRNGLVEMTKSLEEGEGIQIGIKDNNLVLKKRSEALIIRLIDGEFPDYKLVIPKANKYVMEINKEAFLKMLKRMSILSSSKYRSVRCEIRKDQLETITTNPEIGESREVMSVGYKGEDIDIAFNPRYVIDALNTMRSEKVRLSLNDGETPCIVEGDDDPGFLGVLMPMRI